MCMRCGLADVISVHDMLTNHIVLLHSETVVGLSICKTTTGAVLGLQIKQAVNNEC